VIRDDRASVYRTGCLNAGDARDRPESTNGDDLWIVTAINRMETETIAETFTGVLSSDASIGTPDNSSLHARVSKNRPKTNAFNRIPGPRREVTDNGGAAVQRRRFVTFTPTTGASTSYTTRHARLWEKTRFTRCGG